MKEKNDNKNSISDDFEESTFPGYGMDKDDALNKVIPFRLIEIVAFTKMNIVEVLVGADDPIDLWGEHVRKAAKDMAEAQLISQCTLINESDVIVNGQNESPFKLFTFKKYE